MTNLIKLKHVHHSHGQRDLHEIVLLSKQDFVKTNQSGIVSNQSSETNCSIALEHHIRYFFILDEV